MDLNGSKWITMDLDGSEILGPLSSCCEVGIKDLFDLVFTIYDKNIFCMKDTFQPIHERINNKSFKLLLKVPIESFYDGKRPKNTRKSITYF